MKKRYKKPQIFMESFEVSEFIAANCNRTGEGVSVTDPNFDENGQYNFGGIMIFNTGCENEAKDFGFSENDKACYDIPIMTLSTHS